MHSQTQPVPPAQIRLIVIGCGGNGGRCQTQPAPGDFPEHHAAQAGEGTLAGGEEDENNIQLRYDEQLGVAVERVVDHKTWQHALFIKTAAALGLVKGDDGATTVRPDATVNRAEAAVLLLRFMRFVENH